MGEGCSRHWGWHLGSPQPWTLPSPGPGLGREGPPVKLTMGEMIYLSGDARQHSSQRPQGLLHLSEGWVFHPDSIVPMLSGTVVAAVVCLLVLCSPFQVVEGGAIFLF